MGSGEGDPLHRAGPAVGHPPDGSPAQRPALPRVLVGDGAPRLDTHAAKRAATAITTGI